MARAQYRIGKISSLMGITSEALRYYEHEGVIVPEKAEDSGYRFYDAWDVHMLIRTRLYRRYGLSLTETIDALNTKDYDSILDKLHEKETNLAAAIVEQQCLLDQLVREQRTLRDALVNLGKFRIETSPAMHHISTQDAYQILDEKMDLYRRWIERVPYATSGGIFEDGRLSYGMVVEDVNIGSEEEEILRDTTPIPAQQCVTTFFKSGSEYELCLEMFEPAFDFIKRHGLRQTGIPFARAVLMSKGENPGVYHSIYQGWVPCEGDCEFAIRPRRP